MIEPEGVVESRNDLQLSATASDYQWVLFYGVVYHLLCVQDTCAAACWSAATLLDQARSGAITSSSHTFIHAICHVARFMNQARV